MAINLIDYLLKKFINVIPKLLNMNKLKVLEEKIKRIEERNKKVEADKKWELSFIRRFLLMLFTYLTVGFYLQALNIFIINKLPKNLYCFLYCWISCKFNSGSTKDMIH